MTVTSGDCFNTTKLYQAPVPLKIIQLNSELDEICLRYGLKKTDPIAKKFCTFQDSTAVLECTQFLSDWIDVREDTNKCYLMKFEI